MPVLEGAASSGCKEKQWEETQTSLEIDSVYGCELSVLSGTLKEPLSE